MALQACTVGPLHVVSLLAPRAPPEVDITIYYADMLSFGPRQSTSPVPTHLSRSSLPVLVPGLHPKSQQDPSSRALYNEGFIMVGECM